MKTSVLFTCDQSSYLDDVRADCWPASRDARLWLGSGPLIAHPPCRAWGRLRGFASPRPGEADLARFSVHMVRAFGGVLEHPEASLLWRDMALPRPGEGFDPFGGWTLGITQDWFGHPAPKKTWLYIVGLPPKRIPALPFVLGSASGRVENQCRAHRERTPFPLAVWLLDLADAIRSAK